MYNLAIQIVRFVDSAFPGWVECELADAEGRHHIIKDKVPTFTAEDLDADSRYPVEGAIRCQILQRYQDGKGQELVRISTAKPDAIESTEGLTEFTVPSSLITSVPD
jgi:hypothetical protein